MTDSQTKTESEGLTGSTTPTSVPDLVGMAAADAHDAALDAQLLAVPQNAWHTGAGRSTVTGQKPKAGEELPPGTHVSIWVDDPNGPPSAGGPDTDGPDGGGGGSPLPSGPKPTSTSGAG